MLKTQFVPIGKRKKAWKLTVADELLSFTGINPEAPVTIKPAGEGKILIEQNGLYGKMIETMLQPVRNGMPEKAEPIANGPATS